MPQHKLSPPMKTALAALWRRGHAVVSCAFPDVPVSFWHGYGTDIQGPALLALWRRGLVTFEVVARLTPDGARAVADDPRVTPGERHFEIVEGNKDGQENK